MRPPAISAANRPLSGEVLRKIILAYGEVVNEVEDDEGNRRSVRYLRIGRVGYHVRREAGVIAPPGRRCRFGRTPLGERDRGARREETEQRENRIKVPIPPSDEEEWLVFSVRRDDVLRALKKFKRLAKQDLLASPLTQDPDFWSAQAEARRAKYAEFMELIESRGVDAAYQAALDGYAALPLVRGEVKDPKLTGLEQAYEMFFTLLGIDAKEIERLRNGRRRLPACRGVAAKASL